MSEQPLYIIMSKKKSAIIVIAAILILSGFLYVGYVNDFNIQNIKEYFIPQTSNNPAEVELYTFSDLVSRNSVNVEMWIINIGDETAKDISVFVRSRNQDGEILFSENISLTVILLQKDDTCSGTYVVTKTDNDTTILHTIEITWLDGRTTYSKETKL